MLQRVLAFVEQYHMIERGEHILAGISGGADSVCLLLVLDRLRAELDLRLSVVHVEHGIRGEDSLKDARFVQELCGRLDIECRVCHCDAQGFSREQGMSLEEGARVLRYRCFEEIREQLSADKIAVAHNQNDCGETLLFHLARGTGLRGMCGIVPVRQHIIRPLLCVSREEIEGYLETRGQKFCTDATNFETDYSRNKIRHKVLPVLREINTGAVEHLYRSTQYMSEAVELVDELAARAEEACMVRKPTGNVELLEKLLEEPPLIQKTLVLAALSECAGSRKDISGVHVTQVLELYGRQVGRRVSLPYGIQARRTYEGVSLGRADAYEGQRRSGKASMEEQQRSGEASMEEQRRSGEASMEEQQLKENGRAAAGQLLRPGETIQIPEAGLSVSCRILEKTEEFHEIPKKRYTKWFDYGKIKDALLVRKRNPEDYFVLDAQGRRQRLKKYFINEKVPAEDREKIPVLAEGAHVLWVIGYRISEAYKVTEDTERILEVQVNGGNVHE